MQHSHLHRPGLGYELRWGSPGLEAPLRNEPGVQRTWQLSPAETAAALAVPGHRPAHISGEHGEQLMMWRPFCYGSHSMRMRPCTKMPPLAAGDAWNGQRRLPLFKHTSHAMDPHMAMRYTVLDCQSSTRAHMDSGCCVKSTCKKQPW